MNVSAILYFAEIMFWHFLQISLHLSTEMADLQNVDYLSMFFRSFVGEYCEWNIEDFVILLNFPMSKLRILDLFCFEGISSFFCASFFLASKLLRMCFAVVLASIVMGILKIL